ncbi:MAG: DUF6449 domain-containing protein, partial [Eubacteriales bacterium]|nr:DUF6449 domain-containing protein [Eubacteriales bacterium]
NDSDHLRAASFIARQRELFKRRLWPAALTFVCFLLYHAAGTLTVLLSVLQELEASSGGQRVTEAGRLRALTDAVSAMMGRNSFAPYFLVLFLAPVLAIEGFAWMDSRREVDFYESQPVSRTKRFWDICVSGFLYFLFSYLITLEIGLLIAGAMGALTHAILFEVARQVIRVTALFVCVYGLGILSAMLTGNVIVAVLAFFCLLFYEICFKTILTGYCEEFLETYSGIRPGGLEEYIFTPLYHYTVESDVECVLRLLALAVLYFLLAFICCRLRRNECAESAVVFGPVRSVVRVAIAVIVGLFIGLLLASIQNNMPLAILWMLLFTLLTACIMEIIYEYDFRALFRHPLEIAAAFAITTAVFLGFLFDIAGYDRYLPDPGKVAEAALICNNYDSPLYNENGRYVDSLAYGDQYMHLENVEDVIAVAKLGQDYTRSHAVHNPFYRSSAADEENAAVNTVVDQVTDSNGNIVDVVSEHVQREQSQQTFLFTVLYRMKNGKTISRKFEVPSTADPAIMDNVIGTEAFREGTFGIYHDDAVRMNAKNVTLEYENGNETSDPIRMDTGKYEALRKAYLLDLTQFSYTFARAGHPFGRIWLNYASGRDSSTGSAGFADETPEDMTLILEVYPSFRHTIAFLQENGVWVEPIDYDSLPRYDDENLSREDRARIDAIDWSVFNGLFNPSPY